MICLVYWEEFGMINDSWNMLEPPSSPCFAQYPSPCEAPETATADCSSGVAETAEDLFGAAFFEVRLLWKGSMCHVFFMIYPLVN